MIETPAHHLQDAGLRVTGGRVALLDAIESRPHSDAETLVGVLRKALPTTSVQSVHNMLNDLTKAGLLRRIAPTGSPSRYERRTGDNHHHLVCSHCGAVSDVDCAIGSVPCLTPSEDAGYAVTSAEVTFWGICAACQEAKSTTPQTHPSSTKTRSKNV